MIESISVLVLMMIYNISYFLYYRLSFSFELKRYFFPFEKSENPFFFFFLEKFGREAFGKFLRRS